MPKAQKLTLAVLINAALITSTYASEQSEAKGFVEDANGDVLFRTGYLTRDKKMVLKTLVHTHKQLCSNSTQVSLKGSLVLERYYW
jgi:hypothetical protein